MTIVPEMAVGADLPRLAYVSPLPPLPSGIADYSAELLPALARHFHITLVVEQAQVQSVPLGMAQIDSATFLRQAAGFDHVLYHFGNSPYHAHMVGLLRRVPGVVVLHDVFLGHLLANVQLSGRDPAALRRALWQSHGWAAMACWRQQGLEAVLQQFPASGEVLAQSRGVIVHSRHARQLLMSWFGPAAPAPVWVSPLPQATPAPTSARSRADARRRLGVPPDVFLVCAFGYAGPGKMAAELVQAWHDAGLAAQPSAWLRLVGGHQFGGASAQQLDDSLQRCVRTGLTGYVDAATYQDYLAAADLAVQLRAASRGETSRAVLEVIAHGIPLILNAHGANAEVPPAWVCRLNDPLQPDALAAALREAWREPGAWRERARQARLDLVRNHAPEVVAAQYASHLAKARAAAPSVLAQCREVLQQQMQAHGRPAWHQAHRQAAQALRGLTAASLPRWRPPLELLALPPRQPGRVARGLRVLMVTTASLAPPRHGNDRRSAAMLAAYRDAGWQVTVCSVDAGAVAALPSSPHWDVIHLDAALPWANLEAQLPAGMTALRVVALPRRWLATDPQPQVAVYRGLVARADLVLCHSQGQAQSWRSGSPGTTLAIPDAVDALTLPETHTQAARAAVLSRGRFAMVSGFHHPVTLQAFQTWVLGASLAYLPPDLRLILVGRLGDAMREVPAFQRWAGINLARGMIAGCLDETAYEAARRHAWVKVVLPGLGQAQHAPSQRLREALQDPGWVLAPRSAVVGAGRALSDPRVVIEDQPERFRQRLVALLQGPAAPAPDAPAAPAWHEVMAALPVQVSALAAVARRVAQEPMP